MSSLNEKVNAEAARILQEQQDAARILHEETAKKSREEAERIQAEAQAKLTKQLEEEARIMILREFLEQVGVRSLLQQANREVWGNVGTIMENEGKIDLVSPPYVGTKTIISSGMSVVSDDVTYYEDSFPAYYAVVMSVEAVMNEPQEASEKGDFSIRYSDGPVEVWAVPEDVKKFPLAGGWWEKGKSPLLIDAMQVQDFRAKLEDAIVSSSAVRKAYGVLPKDLIANSLPWPKPPHEGWLARAKRALRD